MDNRLIHLNNLLSRSQTDLKTALRLLDDLKPVKVREDTFVNELDWEIQKEFKHQKKYSRII